MGLSKIQLGGSGWELHTLRDCHVPETSISHQIPFSTLDVGCLISHLKTETLNQKPNIKISLTPHPQGCCSVCLLLASVLSRIPPYQLPLFLHLQPQFNRFIRLLIPATPRKLLLRRSPMLSLPNPLANSWVFSCSASQKFFKTVDYSVLETLSCLGFGDNKQVASCLCGCCCLLTGTPCFYTTLQPHLPSFCFWNLPSLFEFVQCICTNNSPCLVATWRFCLIIQLKYHYLKESLTSLCKINLPLIQFSYCFIFSCMCSVLSPYLGTCLLFFFLLKTVNSLRANSVSVVSWRYTHDNQPLPWAPATPASW